MDRLGRYEILRRLGVGGMGEVFLAQDKGTGARVAVKKIHSAYSADRSYRARFAREVATAGRVRSRFTAALVDYELEAEPRFIVTEYVSGATLDRAGVLTGDRLVALARDTAAALRDTHAVELVHRDLKASNVIVARDRAVLIDFGIAAHVSELGVVTSTGKVVGSLPYLAPELFGTDQASYSSDVYSWGCLVHYAATGREPFIGDTGRLVHRIRTEEADVRAVPGSVRELVAAALSKNPRLRPTVAEILADLDAVAAPLVLCGTDGYTARLRDVLVDAGLPVRVSRDPDVLADAAVLLAVEDDRPDRVITDMRAAAVRRGVTVLPVAVGVEAAADVFLDARVHQLPGREQLRELRRLVRAPRAPAVPESHPDRVLEPVREALARGDLVGADQLTTVLLLTAAGGAEVGWADPERLDTVETEFLRSCARIWHDETERRHGFRAQRDLYPADGDLDLSALSRAFGWGEPRVIPADYHRWTRRSDFPAGFFPTLRAAEVGGRWFDRWDQTVSAVHRRLRGERL
ncbi:serine/threonine-protein kinase [Actinokineospora enzanensis]|uniref:serine/threonine-protein kinase n=1 Tax=Actinokineospora enzanensis TaxID=155975 RepID=UPI0006862A92|nr:serine/threonine-protein kinase [Actinokineospora enzanensis]